MLLKFHILLCRKTLEKEDQRKHAEYDSAKHSQFVHMRKRDRLTSHSVLEILHCDVATICGIFQRGGQAPDILLHKVV